VRTRSGICSKANNFSVHIYCNDPDRKGYSTCVHLAEVIGMLGPSPLNLLERGERGHDFFAEYGT
jgi:serine/threonine-protein kinase SRPK3